MKKELVSQTSENSQTSSGQSKLNASQKLELLEMACKSQSQQIVAMSEEIERLGSIVTALAKRINAVVRSAEEGHQISSKQVNSLLVSDAAKELEDKVIFLVDQGILVSDNDSSIGELSFVVGREINSDGEEVNPRIQFAVKSLEKEGQEKVLNRKVGDLIEGEDGISMEITQLFSIVEPKLNASESSENLNNSDSSESELSAQE